MKGIFDSQEFALAGLATKLQEEMQGQKRQGVIDDISSDILEMRGDVVRQLFTLLFEELPEDVKVELRQLIAFNSVHKRTAAEVLTKILQDNAGDLSNPLNLARFNESLELLILIEGPGVKTLVEFACAQKDEGIARRIVCALVKMRGIQDELVKLLGEAKDYESLLFIALVLELRREATVKHNFFRVLFKKEDL